MNSGRSGQAQTTLNAVRQRHEAIQNIERTMIELAELFQDLDTMVLQQDEVVRQIEEKGEEVQENIFKANEELDVGIKSARGARKKKWICLILTIVILIIIAIVVAVYILVIKPGSIVGGGQPAQKTVTAAPAVTTVAPAPVPTATRAPKAA